MENILEMKKELRNKRFPCPLCEFKQEIRISEKNNKPYIVCDYCGVQLFIRKKEGVNKLIALINSDNLLGI